MAKCTLSTGKLPLGCLPRNSSVRITDRPDFITAVYRGLKASKETNSVEHIGRVPATLNLILEFGVPGK